MLELDGEVVGRGALALAGVGREWVVLEVVGRFFATALPAKLLIKVINRSRRMGTSLVGYGAFACFQRSLNERRLQRGYTNQVRSVILRISFDYYEMPNLSLRQVYMRYDRCIVSRDSSHHRINCLAFASGGTFRLLRVYARKGIFALRTLIFI